MPSTIPAATSAGQFRTRDQRARTSHRPGRAEVDLLGLSTNGRVGRGFGYLKPILLLLALCGPPSPPTGNAPPRSAATFAGEELERRSRRSSREWAQAEPGNPERPLAIRRGPAGAARRCSAITELQAASQACARARGARRLFGWRSASRRSAGAAAEFRRAIQLKPPNLRRLTLSLGVALRRLGDEKGALAAFRRPCAPTPTIWRASTISGWL